MNNVVADLHVHTTESDGTTDPSRIPELARENNLDLIAVTDHDTYHDFGRPVVSREDVDIVSGIELRVEAESVGERIDLLGYGVTPTEELDNIVDEVRQNRKNRAEEIVRRIEEETGAELEFEPTVSTGRPHIARAVEENDQISYDYHGAFNNLIGSEHYCYVSRDIPTFEEGVEALKSSTLCTSLAHPYRYDNVESVLELATELDAIECNYSYGEDVEVGELPIEKTEEFDMGVTGGSDAHQPSSIGKCGLNEEETERFVNEFSLSKFL